MTTAAPEVFMPVLIGNYLVVDMATSTNPLGRGVLVTSYITMVCESGDEIHVITGPDEHQSPRYVCARIPNPAVRIREFSELIRMISGIDPGE